MIAIYNSGKPGFGGVLVDTDTREVLADLVNITDGWKLATKYKKDLGIRCATERISEVFNGFDNEGYHQGEAGEFVSALPARSQMADKYSVCERFQFMDNLIDMVMSSITPSAIITGPAGIGKSHSILRAIERAAMKEGDYMVVKGQTTPLGLYSTLHDNRRALIIFDDCDSAFKDPLSRNILKAALDSTDKRVISWISSKLPDEYENSFEFKGRVLFVSNIPLSGFDPTLISRSMIIDLQMSRDEIVDHIAEIAPQIKTPNIKPDKTAIQDVVDFLKEEKGNLREINIRTFMKILAVRHRHAKDDVWKGMSEFMSCI